MNAHISQIVESLRNLKTFEVDAQTFAGIPRFRAAVRVAESGISTRAMLILHRDMVQPRFL